MRMGLYYPSRILYAVVGAVCLLQSLLPVRSWAQQGLQPNDRLGACLPPSPQAAALGKFAQTPVSLYTGVPSISIPIAEVGVRGASLPISLTYHAGGVRVSETAGPVGLGWALQAGGTISCSVVGKNDQAYLNSQGGGYQSPPLDRPLNPVFGSADYDYCMRATGTAYAGPGILHTADTQPDLWYYAFAGRSGKFFHPANDALGQSMPYEPLRIYREANASGYTVTDDTGNRYLFRAIEQTTTFVSTYGRMRGPFEDPAPRAHAFYLTQVITPARETITLTYDTLTYDYPNSGNFTRYLTTATSKAAPNGCADKAPTSTQSLTKVSGLQLATIRSSRGDFVEFRYSTCSRLDLHRGRALERILVHQGPQTREFVLSYGYFGLPAATSVCGPGAPERPEHCRLKLLSVRETGKPAYRLRYQEPVPLPSRLSASQDHWGFFNGAGNADLLPAEPAKGFYQGADRTPSPLLMQTGTLASLQYPTGGRTDFVFEPNTYYAPPGTTFAHTLQQPVVLRAGRDDDSTPGPSERREQAITFTVPATVDLNTIQVVYKTGCGQATNAATPQFAVALTGPNGYRRDFGWEPGQPADGMTRTLDLVPGTYTAAAVTYGYCPDDFFLLRWTEAVPEPGRNVLAGGLRVREVRDYDGLQAGPVLRRRYQYTPSTDTTHSSGHVLYTPTYTYESTDYTYLPQDTEAINTTCTYVTQSSNSVQPLSTIQGSSVAYTHVRVFQDRQGEHGLTTHSFSWAPDLQRNPSYPFTPPTTRDWQRGLPLEVVDYAAEPQSPSRYRPVRRVRTRYQHNYTPPGPSCESATRDCDDYRLPTGLNERHALGVNIVAMRPESIKDPNLLLKQVVPAQFLIESFKYTSVWSYPVETAEYRYARGADTSAYQVVKTFFRYDNPQHAQRTRTLTLTSAGDTLVARTLFPLDYDSTHSVAGPARGLRLLARAHVLTAPVEQQQWVQKGTAAYLLGGALTQYAGLWPASDWQLHTAAPVPTAQVSPSAVVAGQFHQDGRYVLQSTFDRYDARGNLLQAQPAHGPAQAMLWGYEATQPLARAQGATYAQVASTSFEPGSAGRWQYAASAVTSGGHTGRQCYQLGGSAVVCDSIQGSEVPFRLTFWATTAPSVTQNGDPVAVAHVAGPANREGFRFYAVTLSLPSPRNTVRLTATAATRLDDVRLCPADARLTSYTHDPLLGLTSQTGPDGRAVFYEYDAQGRLQRVRDEQGRVLSETEYQYAHP